MKITMPKEAAAEFAATLEKSSMPPRLRLVVVEAYWAGMSTGYLQFSNVSELPPGPQVTALNQIRDEHAEHATGMLEQMVSDLANGGERAQHVASLLADAFGRMHEARAQKEKNARLDEQFDKGPLGDPKL